ncbi:MurR/RpiR family transcriptional regulator [Alkalibacillus salilacus]|uniref:DNA-binding MurR/RpiR family transcriptional regulator n=1 Tax=Alkalibacillus salilacus TaxID=284582 RepID=A0ABT9VIS9_9BACI|nr:MurR/RpiR family transcriptional regulator [Alkalibacillus salilacus]MDQ0160819.1 DNA-binding MurR/RpiR family transcriptional regulator [Alkalibacillus salilacus]
MSELKGGLVILKEMVGFLPNSERKIADYMIQHPEEAIQMTAASLGKASQTSSAAVIRMCKSIGFKSFQELKLRVAGDLQQGNGSTDYRDIKPNEDTASVIDTVTANTIQTIKESVDVLDKQELERAVKAIINAESITFVGFGASYIAASDAAQKFVRINKHVHSFSDLHMAATTVANKDENDVVVGLSFSGETAEVAKVLGLARQKGIQTISVTKYGKSKVADQADINLHTSAAREATFRSGATSSRMAQLHVIDMLFMSLAAQQYEQSVQYIDETREAISYIKRDL